MRYAILLTPLLLVGCVEPQAPVEPTQPPTAPGCTAASLQGLIGQPSEVAERMSLPPGSRIIGPNQPVTMDFRADRLNIETGRTGLIEKISCY